MLIVVLFGNVILIILNFFLEILKYLKKKIFL